MLASRRMRKACKAAFAWLFLVMYVITSIPTQNWVKVAAAQSEYSFDFGANGTQSGFIGVSASESYDSSKGYGFNTPSNMADVAASGSGELSDAVQFKSTDASNTFNVDLPNGLYEITVYLGNTMRTSIWAEECMQVVNMTGDNAKHTWQMPITDGQLNIRATAGKEGYAFTMSALIIKKLSDDPKMSQTVWICGDSTVCNYYPLDTSVQGGWGQMLDQYIDTNKWQVRNMAASGQYAKGFVDAGQFTPILKYGKSGDIYIISIGINDTNYSTREEYHDTVYDMAKQAMEKGMKVVLVKQQGRADDISRSTLLTGRWFSDQLDVVGKELGVQVVDLFNLAQDYYLSIGQDAVYNLYMSGDTLHPNREGAKVLAKLMSEQIDFVGIKENVDGSRYYAVDASYENAIFENYNLGYSGRGYVNFDNMVGSNITFEVDVEEAGNYLVTFRVANGSVNDRAMKIEVNDGTDYWIQPFTSTGSYTTWEDRGIVLPLNAGTNKIKATATMSEGGPNLDYIELEKTDEPIAETYQPEQTTQAPAVNRNTTVYIAGDSTAQSYRASYAPQQGWGYYLNNYLGDSITVYNHAIAGRSSKSFYDNGRLTTILNEIQQGDYLLVQFGINDSSSIEERSAPVCGSVENATDGSFEYYIKMYIQGALDKGAMPVLISPTLGLKAYSNGSFVNSYTNYADAMRNLSNYYNVPFVDMNSLMVQNYNSVGYDAAKLYHLYGVVEGSTDMTHFSEAGADNAARLVSEPIKEIIAQYTPTTQAPTTQATTTQVTTTQVTTQEPTTQITTTQAPTTQITTTQAPAIEVTTTQAPATEVTTTQVTTTELPTTQMPVTESSTTQVSTTAATQVITTQVPATQSTTETTIQITTSELVVPATTTEMSGVSATTTEISEAEVTTAGVPMPPTTTQDWITTGWYPITTENDTDSTTEYEPDDSITTEDIVTTSGCPNTTENPGTNWYPVTSEDASSENPGTNWYPITSEDASSENPGTNWYPSTSEDTSTENPGTNWYPVTSEDTSTENPGTSWYPVTSEDTSTENPGTNWYPVTSEDTSTENPGTNWYPSTSEDATTEDNETSQYPIATEDSATTQNTVGDSANATTQNSAPANTTQAAQQDVNTTQQQTPASADFVAGETFTITWLNAVIQFNTVNANGGTVTYVKPVKAAEEIVIPNTICMNNKVYKVTAIGENAFANCKKLKKVTIGSKVVKIGKRAFYKCKNLNKVVIKTKKLKKSTVGKQAFKGISKKVTIKVPKGKLKLYKQLMKK